MNGDHNLQNHSKQEMHIMIWLKAFPTKPPGGIKKKGKEKKMWQVKKINK